MELTRLPLSLIKLARNSRRIPVDRLFPPSSSSSAIFAGASPFAFIPRCTVAGIYYVGCGAFGERARARRGEGEDSSRRGLAGWPRSGGTLSTRTEIAGGSLPSDPVLISPRISPLPSPPPFPSSLSLSLSLFLARPSSSPITLLARLLRVETYFSLYNFTTPRDAPRSRTSDAAIPAKKRMIIFLCLPSFSTSLIQN